MSGQPQCEFPSVSVRPVRCVHCGWSWKRSGPPPRRVCPGPSSPQADGAPARVLPRAERRTVSDAEVEALLDDLWRRHELGLATVPWEETLRRVGLCRSCPDLAPPGDCLEIRCDRCQGCQGDRGHKLRLALTTNERTCPAGRFDRLAVCTTYFNPVGYRTRRQNFRMFADAALSQGADLWVIEAGTPGRWEVEERPGLRVVRMEWRDSLWQKERLLNLLIEQLPASYNNVAWVDHDVLFDNPDWVTSTNRLLGQHLVCQLFEQSLWLNPWFVPERWVSSATVERPSIPVAVATSGKPPSFALGHPGFAWAARRETLAALGGLYDQHIMGSGDTIMVLGFYGWLEHEYLDRFAGPFRRVAERWMRRAAAVVQARVGYVPGRLRHLWHGSRADRQYDGRLITETIARFDPDKHLKLDPNGLWAWTDATPQAVKDAVNEYFHTRREDGPQDAPAVA